MAELSHFDAQLIDIDDVKVGMYIEDVFAGQNPLAISENRHIVSSVQLLELKKRGIRKVRINLEKDKTGRKNYAIRPDVIAAAVSQEDEYYDELDRAKDVHKEGVLRVSEVLTAIREGHPFSFSIIKNVANDIVESLLRNPDALVSLSQLKSYDNYTFVHSVNVSILITSLAKTMGFPEEKLVDLSMGGLLHDVGKMRVPEQILNKPGKLTDTEFSIIKRHPEFGYKTIIDQRGISDLTKKIVLQHHERYNGKGYPYGLKGERIHEVGLISAITDVFDALTSDRVYKAAWTPQKALAVIFQGADKDYSRRIVELFTRHLGIFPVGSFVKLATGEMGVVSRVDRGQLLAPEILVLFDKFGRRLPVPQKIELSRMQKGPNGELYKIEGSLSPKAFDVDIGEYIQQKY